MNKLVFTLVVLSAILVGKAQTYKSYLIPGPINTSNGAGVPTGFPSDTKLVLISHISAAEMASFPNNLPIHSFGFNYINGVLSSAPVTGSIQVYFQHTSDSSYQKGTNWLSAINGMSSVYNGTMTIPSCPTNTYVDLPFPSAFTYTGGAMYIAYEWTFTGPYAYGSAMGMGISNSGVASSCFSATTNSTITPLTITGSVYRPTFRFGTINTFTNDAQVLSIVSPAQLHTSNSNTLHSVKAEIMNNSAITQTNLQVNLVVNGLVSHTDNVVIPSLAAGNYTTVTFSSYSLNPSVSGVNSISVSVGSDEDNTNNLKIWTQSVSCNSLELAPHLQPGSFNNRMNFNYSPGFYILNKLFTKNQLLLSGMNIAISNDSSHIGNTVTGVILSLSGMTLGQSNSITLTSGNINSYVTFSFPGTVNLPGDTTYFFGLYQPANNSIPYPPIALTPTGNALPMDNWYLFFSTPTHFFHKMPSSIGIPAIELLTQGSCHFIGLTENVKESPPSIRCFPNPARQLITINLTRVSANTNLDILNVLGQKVGSIKDATDGMSYDVSGFSPGVYFLKSGGNSFNSSIYKFMVVE
ncbi:MAG: T9SS type A sorting domain-containing protein [Sediminibacterium sp.]|nr:T9SS type A sorting domain-containing protein [Sediminibacterium sp.]